MKTLEILTVEKFQEIYTDQKFRNSVAYAHSCYSANHVFLHLKTCSYPVEYTVTQAQKNEAMKEVARAKDEVLKKHENDLLFCCMGMSFEPRFEDDFCNYRARTEFLNADGKRFFIEVGTSAKGDNLRVDFSIDRDLQIYYDSKRYELHKKEIEARKNRNIELEMKYRSEKSEFDKQIYYNFGGIERTDLNLKFTKQNVLELVNKIFGCNFKNIIVDQYTIHPDDREIICKSPKF